MSERLGFSSSESSFEAAVKRVRSPVTHRSTHECQFGTVPGGLYRVAPDPRSGTHIRAVQSGNQNLLRSDLIVDGGDISLTIVVGGPAATLTGRVDDAANRPVYDGIVALVPEDSSDIRLFRSTRTAADGTFRLEDLAPGEYALYAWRELPGAAYRNEQFMEAYESLGHPVTLAPGEDLRVEMEVLEQRP